MGRIKVIIGSACIFITYHHYRRNFIAVVVPCESVASLTGEDGFWYVSTLNPKP